LNEADAAADAFRAPGPRVDGRRVGWVAEKDDFSVTRLRELMIEELRRRNFAENHHPGLRDAAAATETTGSG
jgi:hypothetical protein